MSNDLISRSALLEDFRNTITEKSDTFDWLNMISRQPIAYDVDKVVEQLDRKRFEAAGFDVVESKNIFRIAKEGGVNED